MRKIDIIVKILLEEQIFYLYGSELCKNTGIEFFEVFDFNCANAVKAIIGEDFFGENYCYNIDPFIEGWRSKEDFEIKMLEWDITLIEEISLKQKSDVIEELVKVKRELYSKISNLNEYGVYFRGIEEEKLLEKLLEQLS
ncbi:hypothetical protein ACFFJQ_14315 [Bacillus capparidis]|uniref:Uncharacterized protein n=1 Tax=Bacillus capparidis TaxID=1840411 RepID=A0ABS4CT94_9BACI|nr:hypothetical protein [Bacillus capparidis]MBP1080779.1 hypothetical protein [Bacillus capparidis]MED1094631.1 hypothetical protein [Bacillus capparidis]